MPASFFIRSAKISTGCADSVRVARMIEERRLIASLRDCGLLFGAASTYDMLFKGSFEGYKNVPYQSAQASAAVMVWKDAFERANSLDTEKVRDAIASTNMATFYGKIKFSSAGNNLAKPMVLRQIQNGKLNVVAPSKWASHPVDFPRSAKY